MYLTMLLIDFLHEDWSGRCCELRSQEEPFRIQTGDYRPLPVGASGLDIGAENIFGDGWGIRLDSPYDPVDRWLSKTDEYVTFEIKYSGVTPPMAGVGAYNLVLPRGWQFCDIQVDNPNHSGSDYEIGRDDEADREALMLYFEGANTRFKLTVQAVRRATAGLRRELSISTYSRHIVEPSPADVGLAWAPDEWMTPDLASALYSIQNACRSTNIRLYTAHVLLALLRIDNGFAKACFSTVRPDLPAELTARLSAYARSLTTTQAGPYHEFAWTERSEMVAARRLAARSGQDVINDAHVLRAILASKSITRQQLGELLGADDARAVQAAEELAAEWPPGDQTPGHVWDSHE
jgi:hypothetical protein